MCTRSVYKAQGVKLPVHKINCIWGHQPSVQYIFDGLTIKFGSMRNNDMWFEGKWVQLKDIILNEVSQAQKHKGHMFSLVHGRYVQKINTYTKASIIIYTLYVEHVC
jgi:hypothetical protein